MAKELMEIGGFITEGAEIVNHDNSFSGYGSVDSPLGLNETVLWESDYSSSTTTLTLSESYLHFEIIAVYWSHNNVTNEVQFYYTPAVDKSASKKARWMCRSGRENSGNIYDFCAVWIQDTETKLKQWNIETLKARETKEFEIMLTMGDVTEEQEIVKHAAEVRKKNEEACFKNVENYKKVMQTGDING